MIQYLQLEKRNTGIVNTNQTVLFDTNLQSSGNNISYDYATGDITFHVAGVYHINWFVAQQTGLATDGSNFAIIQSLDNMPRVIGSNHVKISQTSGFAIIKTGAADIKVRLANVSNAAATLSDTTQVKAGLAVYRIDSDTTTANLGYLQAQVTTAELLDDLDPVNFDNLISQDPGKIVDQDLTEFKLANPGTYLVNWEVPVQATNAKDYVELTLNLNAAPVSTARIPLPIGVLAGSAMVVNSDVDGMLTLTNTTGDHVKITGMSNIVITQITELPVPPTP